MIIDYNIELVIENAIKSVLGASITNVYTRGDSRNCKTPFVAAQAELKDSLEHFRIYIDEESGEQTKLNCFWNANLSIFVKTNRKDEAQDNTKYEYIQAVRTLMNPLILPNGPSKGVWKLSLLQAAIGEAHFIYDLKDTGTSHGTDDKEDFDITTLSYSLKVGINLPKPT